MDLWRYRLNTVLRRLPLGHLIYDQTMSSFIKDHVQSAPFYVGKPERGSAILNERLYLPNHKTIGLFDFWQMRHTSPDQNMVKVGIPTDVIRQINRFDWLADLQALHQQNQAQSVQPAHSGELALDETAQAQATMVVEKTKLIILNWISCHQHWSALSWHVPTLARRIQNWLYFYQVFIVNVTIDFDRDFFPSITRQLNHLRISVMAETHGFERIMSLICWVNASFSLTNEVQHRAEGLRLLYAALNEETRQPASELFSSPRLCLETYLRLHQLCFGYLKENVDIPPELLRHLAFIEKAIDSMKLKNNDLPHFHSSWAIALKHNSLPKKHRSKTPQQVEISQNKRVTALINILHEGFSVVMDASSSPKAGQGLYMHASPLAIEVYDGDQPLFINATPPHEATFHDMQRFRQNHYHSMPVVDDFPIGNFRADGTFGKSGYQIITENIACSAENNPTMQRVACKHNAYQRILGALLEREINVGLSEQGQACIFGHDILEFGAELQSNAALRLISIFHLHPSLTVNRLDGGGMLILPKNRKLKQVWRFEPTHQGTPVGETISINSYLPDGSSTDLTTLWIEAKIDEPQAYQSYRIGWKITRLTV